MAGIVLALASVGAVQAAEVQVAVAANFASVLDALAAGFNADTGNTVVASPGATGALYTQITQGAPFEVFLSADNRRPRQAVDEGFGVEGSVFTYAIGKVVLYSKSIDVADGTAVLKAGHFQHIAVADPTTAPYGVAAIAVIESLGLTAALAPKVVTGQTVTQAFQFVDSGNAELGFVALSQVIGRDGSQWVPPTDSYPAIVQEAVLLKPGAGDPAAEAFLDYLKSPEAVAIIEAAGYEVP